MINILKQYWPSFLYGASFTMFIALLSTFIGLIIGLIVSLIKNNEIEENDNLIKKMIKKASKLIIDVYITLFRGTPMMVQAMIIYYGVYNLGFKWSKIFAAIVIVSINTGAYMSEIVRSGIQAVNKGQYEASRSLGMNQFQTFIYIILPQAIRNTFPAIGNEFIVNIKDTSVLNCIGVIELYFQTSSISGSTFKTVETFAIAALIYLFLTFVTSKILNIIELKLNNTKHSFPSSQTTEEGVKALL